MASGVTTEVVNESDGQVVLKQGNAGTFMILSQLPGRGDRFTIKTDPNATYLEYKLVGTSTSASGSSFMISSDDCVENERIVIKKARAVQGELRLDMIKRGMSVTEVVNDTELDFHVKDGDKDVGVLEAKGEYLIQRDPKDKSGTQNYSLVTGGKPPILIPTEVLVSYQRLTISGENPAVTSKIRRGIYLTEVFNRTETNLTVQRKSEASVGSAALETVTLIQGTKSQINYDPGAKNEYWVQLVAEFPKEQLRIPPEYFVEGKRIDIIIDSECSAGVKLVSAEPRSVPRPTPKPRFFSKVKARLGF